MATTAPTEFARWWRQKGRGSSGLSVRELAKLPLGRQFVTSRVAELNAEVLASRPRNVHDLLLLRAGFHELLGNWSSAMADLRAARPSAQRNAALERITREAQAEENRSKLSVQSKAPTSSTTVERVCAAELSCERFAEEYARRGKPVIITGCKLSPSPWTWAAVKKHLGKLQVQLKKCNINARRWARLDDAVLLGRLSLSGYLDQLGIPADAHDEEEEDKQQADDPPTSIASASHPTEYKLRNPQDHYLHDWSLPHNAGKYSPLLQQLCLPKWFAKDNFLYHTTPGTMYRDTWPSFFVGPKGTRSGLHVDAFGSHFWMYLWQGRKRWVLFDRDDLALLHPSYPESVQPLFLAASVETLLPGRRMEFVLEPGELLFVPAGTPHFVENLSHTMAISANFVDHTNLALATRELAAMAHTNSQAAELLAELKRVALGRPSLGPLGQHVPWKLVCAHLDRDPPLGLPAASKRLTSCCAPDEPSAKRTHLDKWTDTPQI